jgi:hypothetical protein
VPGKTSEIPSSPRFISTVLVTSGEAKNRSPITGSEPQKIAKIEGEEECQKAVG